METSKIKRVESVKPYNGQNGTIYYHLLEMENGNKINIGKKKELQVGWELAYEITEKGQQEYEKAKSVAPQQFNGYSKKQNNQTASFALSYAKDLVIGGKVEIANILPTATKLNEWLKVNS